ncbi:MAG: nucleotidyltransferase domain-containing protein [Candidatus Bathyarchaeia archaeon]
MGEETENMIRAIAITRNIIAHAYRRISVEEMQEIRAEILAKIEYVVKELLKIVEQEKLDPEVALKTFETLSQSFRKHGVLLAYLFGSRARGTADEESDYDIAVLFSNDETSIIDEVNLTAELSRAINEPADKIDVLSLNRADLTVKARVLREGVPIYCSDGEFKRMWERKTLMEILEGTDLYAVYIKRALERIRF